MKRCPYCGLQNDDTALECGTCHTALATPPETAAAEARPAYPVSPQEARFWERMTFRQFAILMLRLQAVWLLLNAAVEASYLPRYVSRWLQGAHYATVSSELNRELGLAVLRTALYAAVALAIILYPERLLRWLTQDWIAQTPLNPSLQPTAPAAGSQPGADAGR